MRLDFSQAAPGSREAQLWQWLQQRCQRFGLVLEQLAPASSDASFRRYFRLPSNLHGSLVVMDAPPGLEDCAPFLKVQRLFAQAGLHVPEIMEADLTVGFLLLEDLGQTPYLSALTTETAPSLYGQALQSLVQLQSATQAGTLPPYSAELLKREMELFHEW
jgi:aminoglycoside/choline kinase family phosphotransferase